MTRFYLKLIIPITIACLTFMLIAHAFGATQPPNPVLHGFTEGCEAKPQPCWYGIVPGVTGRLLIPPILAKYGFIEGDNREKSDTIFQRVEDSNQCKIEMEYTSSQNNAPIRIISFYQCNPIQLGSLWMFIQYPGVIHYTQCDPNQIAEIKLTYPYSDIDLEDAANSVSILTPIESFVIHANLGTVTPYIGRSLPRRGGVQLWRLQLGYVNHPCERIH